MVMTDLEKSITKRLETGEKEVKKLKIKKKGKLEFSRISSRYSKDLKYKGRTIYYGDTYYVYKQKRIGGHYALTKLDLEEPIYLHYLFNYNLITHEPNNSSYFESNYWMRPNRNYCRGRFRRN